MVDSQRCWKLSRWKYRWVNILDLIFDSTMVDSQRCWQLSRWKYRWVNILDLIFDSTMVDSQRCWQLSRWKYRWVNILDLIFDSTMMEVPVGEHLRLNILTPQWWIARGASNCLRWKDRSKIDMHRAIRSGTL
ncbi:hypothetical protein E3N88_12984 [Mikania micrantha]|uniref:Uncharacterized protein n=1 Tax=Mikania micrantha TaxID=192012 RepID=A0A5N6P7B0_9ASTR|nr:hypothetical protein E3N88_12984 [Mikania micrantha]